MSSESLRRPKKYSKRVLQVEPLERDSYYDIAGTIYAELQIDNLVVDHITGTE